MRVFSRLLLVFIALILLSELFARTVLTLPVSLLSDDELGYVYEPYSSIFHSSEGWAINKMNSMGFNDDDPDINNGKLHILVLGDSMTESLQVPRSENFTSIAEAMLPCLDFYNAGRRGLSPAHYPTILSRVNGRIEPVLAVVVITFGDMSDISNGNYKIVRDKTDKRIIDLQLNEKPLGRVRVMLDPVLRNSALATYLVRRTKALLINKQSQRKSNNKNNVAGSDPDSMRVREILTFLFESMNSRTPIAILYNPRLEYGVNRVATIDQRSVVFDQLIKDAANIAEVPVLSTETYMKASYSKNGQPGAGFSNKNILGGHLNRLGHRATALALLDLTADAGLRCPSMNDSPGVLTQP